MCSDLVKDVTGEEMEAVKVGDFLDSYLKRRAGEVRRLCLSSRKRPALMIVAPRASRAWWRR